MRQFSLCLLLYCACQFSWCQAPNKMSYQAVVRDADNNLVTNQAIGIKISVLQGALDGTSVFEETHTSNSNINGLVSIVIGEGNAVTGSFGSINWASGTHFIKTEIDPTGGANYTITGVQQLLSVPYAMHANTADNLGGIEGTQVGEMLYWDGNSWATIPVGRRGSVLSNCWDDIPTWGYCMDTFLNGDITATTARIQGRLITNVSVPQNGEIGFCYSTSPTPTVDDLKYIYADAQYGSNIIQYYSATIGGLTPNTMYYFRSYFLDNSGVSYGREISVTTNSSDILAIGDYLPELGGVVFYISQPGDPGYDPNTQHGLIVSTDAMNNDQWGCSGTFIGGTLTDLFSGENNTILVANACPDSAAAEVLNFSSMGFTDWYLGSTDELNELRIQRIIVNNVLESINADLLNINNNNASAYWSSTEENSTFAKYEIMNPNENNPMQNKSNTLKVRPIRTF